MASKRLSNTAIKILVHEVINWLNRPGEGSDSKESLQEEKKSLNKVLTAYVQKNTKAFFGESIVTYDPEYGYFQERTPSRDKAVMKMMFPAALQERIDKLRRAAADAKNKTNMVEFSHALLPSNRQRLYIRVSDAAAARKALDVIADSVLTGDGSSVMEQIRAILAGK